MNVKNLGIKFLCVVVLVALALLALYPPDKKLKPGIDLAGGHSLLYEIDTTGLEGPQLVNLAERIITQLRKRVDPNSQRNLVWRPVGNTRIEIQMPASTGKVREVRKTKEDAIDQLLEFLALFVFFTRGNRRCYTSRGMVLQYRVFDASQSRLYRLHLLQYINAVALVLNHPADSSNLALDSVEPLNRRFFVNDHD